MMKLDDERSSLISLLHPRFKSNPSLSSLTFGAYYDLNKQDSSLWVRNKLPQHLKRLMGEANMSFAKGQHEETIRLCTEIIRQGKILCL